MAYYLLPSFQRIENLNSVELEVKELSRILDKLVTQLPEDMGQEMAQHLFLRDPGTIDLKDRTEYEKKAYLVALLNFMMWLQRTGVYGKLGKKQEVALQELRQMIVPLAALYSVLVRLRQ